MYPCPDSDILIQGIKIEICDILYIHDKNLLLLFHCNSLHEIVRGFLLYFRNLSKIILFMPNSEKMSVVKKTHDFLMCLRSGYCAYVLFRKVTVCPLVHFPLGSNRYGVLPVVISFSTIQMIGSV